MFDERIDRAGNYLSQAMGLVLYLRFLPRVSALAEYEYLIKDFSRLGDDSDHKDHTAYLGVTFDPAGKLKGTAKLGYTNKRFDRKIIGRNNNPKNWVVSIDLTEDFTSFTRLAVMAQRGFMDDYDWGNASYTSTTMAATFQHMFTRKIGSMLSGSLRENRYLDRRLDPISGISKKRLDKIYSGGCGVFYNVQEWPQAGLDYTYTKKDSNFETYSFDESRVMLRVTLRLP